MTVMPFLCLGVGFFFGIINMPDKFYKGSSIVTNVALVFLMLVIGANVGINDDVMNNLDTIGLNSAFICLSAIFFSIILCLFVEKKLIDFEKIKRKILEEKISNDSGDGKKTIDSILILIPFSIITGTIIGYFFMPHDCQGFLNNCLVISLILLYTSVGIGMGSNIGIFKFVKEIGFRIIYLIIAIVVGSLLGGMFASLIIDVPFEYNLISASGMGYYSLTGATMMHYYGAEAGIYGFMVNVMRDFFTVILIPLFVRMSSSAPIASGAGGTMDTLLVPVTKAIGKEMGLVALIVGVIVTLLVPLILTILCSLF